MWKIATVLVLVACSGAPDEGGPLFNGGYSVTSIASDSDPNIYFPDANETTIVISGLSRAVPGELTFGAMALTVEQRTLDPDFAPDVDQIGTFAAVPYYNGEVWVQLWEQSNGTPGWYLSIDYGRPTLAAIERTLILNIEPL